MKLKLLALFSAAFGLLATSCIDDSYDLSNVDTTSRVDVVDLQIPVNFDEVTLSDVIKLDGEDDIKIITIDGENYYAVTRSGDFDSDPIYIKVPEATTPTLESKEVMLSKGSDGYFNIEELGNDFTFSCYDVDKSIVEIEQVKVKDLDFTIYFNTPGTYTNVELRLPLAMTGSATVGTYNPETGIWTIPSITVAGRTKAVYTATSIDFTKNDFSFSNHHFDFTSNFSILSGKIAADGTTLDFKIDYELSDLEVTAVTGKIKYEIEGMEIKDISLENIPNFLKGDGTNVTLANPLLCLSTTNPVAGDKLYYESALSMTANHEDGSSKTLVSNVFTIKYNDGEGPYNTIFSPNEDIDENFIPAGYENNYQWVEYADLGTILAGNGIPKTISVSAENPMIPEQPVKDFVLGRNIPGVIGNYELFAPLSLEAGSTIVYTTTEDGWGEDVGYLTVNALTLTAVGTNNTSLDAQLTIYPLNAQGQRIPGAQFSSTTLPAGATEPITFTLNQTITGLDGVEFVATVVSQDEKILSPDQTIVFKNIRARVTGYYEREL